MTTQPLVRPPCTPWDVDEASSSDDVECAGRGAWDVLESPPISSPVRLAPPLIENSDVAFTTPIRTGVPKSRSTGPRPGRPQGTLLAARDRAFLNRSSPAMSSTAPVAAPAPLQEESAQCLDNSSLKEFMQPIGGAGHQAIQLALARNSIAPSAKVDTLCEHTMGPMPRACLPVAAEARILEYLSAKDFTEDLIVAAATLYFGTRLWTGSMLSRLRRLIVGPGKLFEPICTVVFQMDDSTPMKGKPAGLKGRRVNPDSADPGAINAILPWGEHGQTQIVQKDCATTASCKIYQSSLAISVAMRSLKTHRAMIIVIPLCCPLQVADHNTAENVYSLRLDQLYVPLLHQIRLEVPLNIELATLDKDSSNIKSETHLGLRGGISARSRRPCNVHIISVGQKGAQAVFSKFTSALIGCLLTMRDNGSFGMFKEAIVHVLVMTCDPISGPPPDDDAACVQQREFYLATFLDSGVQKDAVRAHHLRKHLRGDWDLIDRTQWYTSIPNPSYEDKVAWATSVADNLLPTCPRVFNRGRWMRSTESIACLGLLESCNHLLSRSTHLWLGLLSRKKLSSMPLDPPHWAARDVWDIVELPPGQGAAAQDDEEVPAEDQRPQTAEDWVKFNARQKRSASRLASMEPLPEFLVNVITSKPMIEIMNGHLKVAARDWQTRQFADAIKTGRRPKLRMVDSFNQRLSGKYFAQVRDLLFKTQRWTRLPKSALTHKHLAGNLIKGYPNGPQTVVSFEHTQHKIHIGSPSSSNNTRHQMLLFHVNLYSIHVAASKSWCDFFFYCLFLLFGSKVLLTGLECITLVCALCS